MNTQDIVYVNKKLYGLCQDIITGCELSSLSEEIIAQLFSAAYKLTLPVKTEALIKKLSADIDFFPHPIESATALCVYIENSKPQVYYDCTRRPSVFTILHETREIMEMLLKEYCRYTTYAARSNKERRCEQFAAAVLMPANDFIYQVINTGCNVTNISKHYSVSYTAVCIRANELLGYEFRISDNKSGRLLNMSNGFAQANKTGETKEAVAGKNRIHILIPGG